MFMLLESAFHWLFWLKFSFKFINLVMPENESGCVFFGYIVYIKYYCIRAYIFTFTGGECNGLRFLSALNCLFIYLKIYVLLASLHFSGSVLT